jgi:hypothetical protein
MGAGAAAQEVLPEYELKAAFVSKFPQFAEWPESALIDRKTFDVCVVRPSPFGQALEELIAEETLRGRRLVAREINDEQAIETCHVLFIPKLPLAQRKALLARAATRPVLTIGDYDGFLDEGGIVNLRIVDGRVRFDINAVSASRAGLRLSSQLLRLALYVRSRPS